MLEAREERQDRFDAGELPDFPNETLEIRASDWTVGSLALVELLLVVQVVAAIVGPLAGNPPTGDLLEYWVYLVSAVLLPVGAVLWALMERSRWSTVILGVAALAVAVMIWRMQVIWTVQIA